MQIEVKNLQKSQIEITVVLSDAEMRPHVERAARHISEHRDIKGFRRGHAPYEKVKAEVGEMAIYEAALERAVQSSYYAAVKEKSLNTIGMPQVNVKKLAPGNDCEFTATVSVLPKVELPDFSKISVAKKDVTVEDKQVDETMESLRKMRGNEVAKSGPAGKEDKVVVDMDLSVDNVPVEGGQTKDHGVYLSEDYYVPGLPAELLGLKKDDEKKFTLTFPKEHYQKHLAGKDVQFSVKVKDVFERQFPELNEEFAKGFGQESMEKLLELLKTNLQNEATQKEEERQEAELLEQIISKSTFEDIPEVLLDAEKRRIYGELTQRVESQGLTMEDYLASVGKTPEEFGAGYAEQAEKRVKSTLALRAYIEREKIEVSPEEVQKEIDSMKEHYKKDPEVLRQLDTIDTRESLAGMLRNRKALRELKEKLIK
ncbi:MAG: trigger factor [Patescibacteria group bacterium]